MLRKVARLLACAAVGVAMLCMRPTAALAEDLDFNCRGTRQITSTYYTADQMLELLPTTQASIVTAGNALYPCEVEQAWGSNYQVAASVAHYSTYHDDTATLHFDYSWPFDYQNTAHSNSTHANDPQYTNFAPEPPTGTGRMFCQIFAINTSKFPAGRYYVAKSAQHVRFYTLFGRDTTVGEHVTNVGLEVGETYIRGESVVMGYQAAINRNLVAWWDGTEWHKAEYDDNGFLVLPQPAIAISWSYITSSINWGSTIDAPRSHRDCIGLFSIEAMWSADSIITVINGNDGSTVTGTIDNQTDTLMDTAGSDGIVGAVTQGGVSQLTSRLGFIAQIPTVVSSFLSGISSGSASGGLFFPGVTVLGYTLIPAQEVPVWQNGLGALETPIKAFNTGVLALLFVKGAKHVFHKDLLGWDDDEGGSE